MHISYNKLWELLTGKDLNRTSLQKMAGLSSRSIAKLGKNENVNTDTLVRICSVLKCDLYDIMGLEYDEQETAKMEKYNERFPGINPSLIDFFPKNDISTLNFPYNFRFIDLFSGIGGIRLGFESVGGNCVFSSEWNEQACKTYFANFNELPYGDITRIDSKDIPDFEILLAGFPCQPFSIAGVSKKKSLGRATGFLDKTQGTLFFDVVRIINDKRPRVFLLENVKNLKSHDKGNTWKVIMASLEELDYEVFTQVVDGKAWVPQHRERVIIVGFDRKRYGKQIDFDFNLEKPDIAPSLNDIIDKKVELKYTLTDKLWLYLQNYAEKHKAKGNGFGFGLPDLKGYSRTLSARYYKDGSEILIQQKDRNPRRLTPRECARLQGFPDSFCIPVSDTQAYKQFGNSVVVPLMKAVAARIKKTLCKLEGVEYGEPANV